MLITLRGLRKSYLRGLPDENECELMCRVVRLGMPPELAFRTNKTGRLCLEITLLPCSMVAVLSSLNEKGAFVITHYKECARSLDVAVLLFQTGRGRPRSAAMNGFWGKQKLIHMYV